MRSCYSSSSLCGISRAAWRHVVAGTLSLSGSHNQHRHSLRYLPLRPPVPPIALGLAERFFSSSSPKRSTKRSAAKKGMPPPMDSAGGDPFCVVRKGDVIGIYKNLADCQAQVSNSVLSSVLFIFVLPSPYLSPCYTKHLVYYCDDYLHSMSPLKRMLTPAHLPNFSMNVAS